MRRRLRAAQLWFWRQVPWYRASSYGLLAARAVERENILTVEVALRNEVSGKLLRTESDMRRLRSSYDELESQCHRMQRSYAAWMERERFAQPAYRRVEERDRYEVPVLTTEPVFDLMPVGVLPEPYEVPTALVPMQRVCVRTSIGLHESIPPEAVARTLPQQFELWVYKTFRHQSALLKEQGQ